MHVQLLKIFKGAEYQNSIRDYWLLFKLSNNQVIKVFDSSCLSNKMFEGKYYSIQLSCNSFFNQIDIDSNVLVGEIEHINDKKQFKNKEIKIELPDSSHLQISENGMYAIGRLDLVDIVEIKRTEI